MRYSAREVLDMLNNIKTSPAQYRLFEIETSKYHAYELREINVDSLSPGYTNDQKLDYYINLNSEPPPILLDHRGIIIDGFHRVKAQKAKNLPTIMAFVPIGEPLD